MSDGKLTANDRSKAILEWLHVPLTTHRLRGIENDIKAAEDQAREEGFLMGRQDEMARAELLVKHARKDVREQALEDAAKVVDRHVNCMNIECVKNDLGCIGFMANELRALKRAPSSTHESDCLERLNRGCECWCKGAPSESAATRAEGEYGTEKGIP